MNTVKHSTYTNKSEKFSKEYHPKFVIYNGWENRNKNKKTFIILRSKPMSKTIIW